jgi:hypothetical protein
VVSLEDFVIAERQEIKKHPKCVTCNLPDHILAQVEEGREEGYTLKIIRNWLFAGIDDVSYDIPTTTIANHFKFDHHIGK